MAQTAQSYTLTTNDIIKGGHLMVFYKDANNNWVPLAFATSHSLQKTLNTTSISCKDAGYAEMVLPQSTTWQMTTDNLFSLAGYQALNESFEQMKTVQVIFGEATSANTIPATSTTASHANEGEQSIIWDGDNNTPYAYNWQPKEAGYYEQGQAVISSLQITAGAGDNATYQATFQGQGTLTRNYPS